MGISQVIIFTGGDAHRTFWHSELIVQDFKNENFRLDLLSYGTQHLTVHLKLCSNGQFQL